MLSKPLQSEARLSPTVSVYLQDSDPDSRADSYFMQFLPANSVADSFFTFICCRRAQSLSPEALPLLTESIQTSTGIDETDAFPFVLGDFEHFALEPETIIAYKIEELNKQIAKTLLTITKESFFLEKIWGYIKARLKEYKAHRINIKLYLIDALKNRLREISASPEDYLLVLGERLAETLFRAESTRILEINLLRFWMIY